MGLDRRYSGPSLIAFLGIASAGRKPASIAVTFGRLAKPSLIAFTS